MAKLETLPTIDENGILSRRFNKLEGAILIWKRREIRHDERIKSGETIDFLTSNMYVDAQCTVLDSIYEMCPGMFVGEEGSKLLNDMADYLYNLDCKLKKYSK